MKKKIYVIYTGGTIGMEKTEHGYAPKRGFLKEQMDAMPELKSELVPDYTLMEYDPLLDSSNMTPEDWNTIAKDIETNYAQYDGFVVLHGTDTMAYTASALSFMLTGLTKPVILTGSQIPLCEVRNDAKQNLITSFIMAGSYDIPEVCVFFGNQLMRGNRTTKASADNLHAFTSPVYPPLAEANVHIAINHRNINEPDESGCTATLIKDPRIALLKIFPGIKGSMYSGIVTEDLKGLIIEGFGAGNIPDRDAGLCEILQKAKENGTVIVVCSQCFSGNVELGAYEASKILTDASAVGSYDMTREAAVAKLYYLLSLPYSPEKVKECMQTNLRGELTREEIPR